MKLRFDFSALLPRETPDLFDVRPVWPRPWRCLLFLASMLALCLLLDWGWREFRQPRLVPGLVFMGSLATPCALVVLFAELDIRRNVSPLLVLALIAFGGILSLLGTLAMLAMDARVFALLRIPAAWQDSCRGPVEELVKLAVAVAVAFRLKTSWRLNGLLAGAAVGAGFAIFENAGYAFDSFGKLLANEGVIRYLHTSVLSPFRVAEAALDAARASLLERGFLSLFTHVVWSAVSSGAFWAAAGRPHRILFWVPFLSVCALHFLWNSPWAKTAPRHSLHLLLGLAAWGLAALLVRFGIREIAAAQQAVLRQAAEKSAGAVRYPPPESPTLADGIPPPAATERKTR